MRPIQFVEALRFPLLLAEQLDDPHSGQALLQEGVDARDPDADLPIRLPYAFAKQAGHHYHERNHRERPQRQAPIHYQHRHTYRDQREEIAESGHHARGEQLVQCLDVGGHARDQPADWIAIEVRD